MSGIGRFLVSIYLQIWFMRIAISLERYRCVEPACAMVNASTFDQRRTAPALFWALSLDMTTPPAGSAPVGGDLVLSANLSRGRAGHGDLDGNRTFCHFKKRRSQRSSPSRFRYILTEVRPAVISSVRGAGI